MKNYIADLHLTSCADEWREAWLSLPTTTSDINRTLEYIGCENEEPFYIDGGGWGVANVAPYEESDDVEHDRYSLEVLNDMARDIVALTPHEFKKMEALIEAFCWCMDEAISALNDYELKENEAAREGGKNTFYGALYEL